MKTPITNNITAVVVAGLMIPASLVAFYQVYENKADIAATKAVQGEIIKMIERSQQWQDTMGPMISATNAQVDMLIPDNAK